MCSELHSDFLNQNTDIVESQALDQLSKIIDNKQLEDNFSQHITSDSEIFDKIIPSYNDNNVVHISEFSD